MFSDDALTAQRSECVVKKIFVNTCRMRRNEEAKQTYKKICKGIQLHSTQRSSMTIYNAVKRNAVGEKGRYIRELYVTEGKT